MTYIEILLVAISAIRASKMRSFLTTLGIVIGVGAVITMIALGSGAQAAVEAQLNALGTDLLTVSAGQSYWHGVASAERVSVTSDDALALMQKGTMFKAVVPAISRRQQVEFGDQNVNIDIAATTAAFVDARRLLRRALPAKSFTIEGFLQSLQDHPGDAKRRFFRMNLVHVEAFFRIEVVKFGS